VAELYVLVHRECGPIGTFLTAWDAHDALMDFVEDEPDSAGDVFVEPFDVVVAAHEDTPS
jgi:hypothetical protein